MNRTCDADKSTDCISFVIIRSCCKFCFSSFPIITNVKMYFFNQIYFYNAKLQQDLEIFCTFFSSGKICLCVQNRKKGGVYYIPMSVNPHKKTKFKCKQFLEKTNRKSLGVRQLFSSKGH